MRLDTSLSALNSAVNARSNCTHLYDLAVLAMAQARRDLGTRVYDVVMPDEIDQPTTLTVLLDGQPVLEWQVKDWAIAGAEAVWPATRSTPVLPGWWRDCWRRWRRGLRVRADRAEGVPGGPRAAL